MAFRKAKIKEQFNEAIPAVLGWIIMRVLGARYYFIAVTDRRVLFMKASMVTGRPKGLGWADPRSAAQIHDVDINNAVWSKFKYLRPSDGKDVRVNIHRF